MAEAALFAGKMDAWHASQDLPWNRLRYTLVHEHLCRHLGSLPLQILDVGGGDGRDAVPLALLGHKVTLVDFVPEMLEGARQRAAAAGVSDRLCSLPGELAALEVVLAGAPTHFDAILCHNVLQYLPAPEILLTQLAGLLKPGGLLSLLTPNPASESYRLALQQLDFPAALAALDATTLTNVLYGAEVRLFGHAELAEILARAGFLPAVRYGVRCIIDYIYDNALKHAPESYAAILDLERALANRSPYCDLARFNHLLASLPLY